MSILNSLPHTAVAKRRKRKVDSLGGSTDSFPSTVFSGSCWQQKASEAEILEFDKRGISVTDKIYFTTNPNVGEKDIITVTNARAGRTNTYEVRSEADPDATAGLGVAFRIMVERTTTGSTSNA